MNPDGNYNYEKDMLYLDDILDLIENAMQNQEPLSLGRYGHIEIAYLGCTYFPHWTYLYEPYSLYSGATAPISTIKDDLEISLRSTDIVGFHASWGKAWEDRETARMTSELVSLMEVKPKYVCSAFITHEMIKNDRFWKILENKRVVLIGRRSAEATDAFTLRGAKVTYTTLLEGYEEIEKVYYELSTREDWDVAFVSAGIPATILAPRLAKQTKKIVIDFGHALDELIDGESFDYPKLLSDWKQEVEKKIQVSIVMAVYNGEAFLKEAIDSALSQTYHNLEIIIVNDGSTDSTKMILGEINDNRVMVIHLDHNQGAANALNTGIMQAQGDWVAIQDADDNSYPERIDEQVKYLIEHPQLVGIGTLIECIPGGEGVSGGLLKGVTRNKNTYISREDIRSIIFWGSPLTHSAIMFSKAVYLEVGGYSTEFKIAYDYDLWLKLLEKGDIENVPKVLIQYRINKESLSNKDGFATVNEIQIASSRAISRLFKKGDTYQPKVIVIGPLKGCKNYKQYIAPISGLKVKKLIYEGWTKQALDAIRRLKTGKIDAIIVLDGYKKDKIIDFLKSKKLELNKQVFNIYNILE